uniref:Disease resistance protein n=1 Tax=Vitis vinifera TaxID=29760 RepID=A5AK24_VITVI|nr:hypothetical protein VITISV_015027 [Vitis vinifera]
MEGAVVGLAVKAYDEGTKFAGYIKGKNDYVNDLEGNYLELKRVVGTLKARRDDVEAEVNRDKRLQATRECQDWILRVKEIEIELSKLEKEYNRKGKCSWKPKSWFSKSKLSERIAKKSAEVRCLLAEGNFERGVVIAKLVKPVEKMGTLNIEDKQSLHTKPTWQPRTASSHATRGTSALYPGPLRGAHDTLKSSTQTVLFLVRICCPDLGSLGRKTQAILSHFRQPVIACIPPSAKGKDKNDGKSSPTISDSRLQSNDDSATASAPS